MRLGRQHMKDGWLRFIAHKNRNRKPVKTEIPVLPKLQEAISARTTGDMTFLVTEYGKPFTAGFRQLVSRPLQRGRAPALLGSWTARGWRHDRC